MYPNLCDVVVMTDGCKGKKNVPSHKERIIRKDQFKHAMFNYISIGKWNPIIGIIGWGVKNMFLSIILQMQ